jgi:hypothetical protein
MEGRVRDLVMFNLAIDSKLRGCDVVAIRVEDVAASGYTADRATVRQKKTGRPANMLALFRNGSGTPGWTRGCLGRIRCDAQKLP